MKILIVRVSSLGDVLHNMPMVADLRRQFPAAIIDWVVEEAYVSLVRLNAGVDEVIPIALRRWRKGLFRAATSRTVRDEMAAFYRHLRVKEYDLIFDTQGLLKTGLVMGMARLAAHGRRVGLANATEGSGYEAISRVFHTQSIQVASLCHAVERARVVAAAALDYSLNSPADFNLSAPLPTPTALSWLPETSYAVFFHATARAAKQWPVQDWIGLGKRCGERGLPVLLAWGDQKERLVAEELAAGIPNARVLPKLSMQDAMILAQRASLVVGVDTGLTHIAAAFCRPTVEIYCDSPRWKTEGNWSPNIINCGDVGQSPSLTEVDAAVAKLVG